MPIAMQVSIDSLNISHLHFLPPQKKKKKNGSINENTFYPFNVIKVLSLRTSIVMLQILILPKINPKAIWRMPSECSVNNNY